MEFCMMDGKYNKKFISAVSCAWKLISEHAALISCVLSYDRKYKIKLVWSCQQWCVLESLCLSCKKCGRLSARVGNVLYYFEPSISNMYFNCCAHVSVSHRSVSHKKRHPKAWIHHTIHYQIWKTLPAFDFIIEFWKYFKKVYNYVRNEN